MKIKYDNSLYCTIPPQPIESEPTPNELFEDTVAEHLYEEYFFLSFLDIEEERNRELINNGKNKRARQCL